VAAAYQHPTFFEITAAMMFLYFAEQAVDFAVVEVGMGGRLDATNVIGPLVSVITNVSLEHTKVLGDTVEKIAAEKAGIIKQGGILVTASTDERVLGILRDACDKNGSRLITIGDNVTLAKVDSGISGQSFDVATGFGRSFSSLRIPLLGEHQLTNAATAVAAVEALALRGVEVPERAVRDGLAHVRWPGRMELMQTRPYVVIDGAKDPEAARVLAKEVPEIFKYGRLVLVVSISRDKDIGDMLQHLLPIANKVVATRHNVRGRAIEPEKLAAFAREAGKDAVVVYDPKEAVRQAMELAGTDGLVLVTGSLFVVGEARELWFPAVDLRWGREFNES
ncbi:MAG: Mur ligase family protein, partial [Candidatus Aenigmarchaeota archaeon]|nr:Mur ligase family protein [Candidatus Aenigmarchaeota archaeon]